MPYRVRRRGDRWQVVNTQTGQLKAKGTTKKKAEAQRRLLEGIARGTLKRRRR
ncbi:MAG TPA: hypothetical protein VFD49_09120 [Candidatus Dormibacteraeota bacterium]|nr:hypothetical protein [Candidatus Dormibacteraeota bacterium]